MQPNNQRVEVFYQGGHGVHRYQGRLSVPEVGELRQHILAEAHNSSYSIHPGSTKCTVICGKSIGGITLRGI